jgi:hypothetical protein
LGGEVNENQTAFKLSECDAIRPLRYFCSSQNPPESEQPNVYQFIQVLLGSVPINAIGSADPLGWFVGISSK